MKLKKANKTIEKDIEDSKTDNKKKKNNIFQLASDIKSLKQKLWFIIFWCFSRSYIRLTVIVSRLKTCLTI